MISLRSEDVKAGNYPWCNRVRTNLLNDYHRSVDDITSDKCQCTGSTHNKSKAYKRSPQ